MTICVIGTNISFIFVGVVLSTLLDMAESKGFVLFVGVWSTVMFVATGFVIYNLKHKK